MSGAYQELLEHIRTIGRLESVELLLDWDQETKMPLGGLGARAEQLAAVAQLVHQQRSDPRVGALLSEIDGSPSDPVTGTNVRELKRRYERAVKIPSALISDLARSAALAKGAWVAARAAADYAAFAPHLQHLLDLKRRVAECVGYSQEPYDALLDEYEPGLRTIDVANNFATLRGPLAELVRRLEEAPRRPDPTLLRRSYPVARQKAFVRYLAERMGFDFDRGRLDISAHPFCTGLAPLDVRLTARYDEHFLPTGVFGVLHEAGHGVYEQGFEPRHMFTPMGSAVSLGIHESQSRLWENLVGRSTPFWQCFYPRCREVFPDALADVPLEAFLLAINEVKPSLIRVEADEVTYNLHVILRFEIERELVSGRLAIADLPEAWNAGVADLLGIRPAHDGEGCLQDIHWSMGTFGYFPTYSLGNLYAAQFFAAAQRTIPDLAGRLQRGDLRTLLEWLQENIYRHGQRFRAPELVERVTAGPVSAEPFLHYIHTKYTALYGL